MVFRMSLAYFDFVTLTTVSLFFSEVILVYNGGMYVYYGGAGAVPKSVVYLPDSCACVVVQMRCNRKQGCVDSYR